VRFTKEKLPGDVMTQEECAKVGCKHFITNAQLLITNRRNNEAVAGLGDKDYPLDVEWKNCLSGPDVWFNCEKRKDHSTPRVLWCDGT
jgi:hypothetical protein